MKIFDVIEENKSSLLTGLGLGFGLMAAVLSAKAGRKAEKKIKEVEHEEELELNTKDIFKLCWKDFIGVAVVEVASVGCILAGKRFDLEDISKLTIAYEATSKFARVYSEKVKEQIGEVKNDELKKTAQKESMPSVRRVESEYPSLFDGDQYFREPYTGKIFISSTAKLEDAVNQFNDELNTNDEAPLYDLWEHVNDSSPLPLNKHLLDGDSVHTMGFIRKNGLITIEYDVPEHEVINGNKVAYTPIRFVDRKHNRFRDPLEYYEESTRWKSY